MFHSFEDDDRLRAEGAKRLTGMANADLKKQLYAANARIWRMQQVVKVAKLIDKRWNEGSLQADIAEDCLRDGLVPIQYELRDALAALGKGAT